MNEEMVLQEIGLDKKEARAYTTLLGLGSTTASKLAARAGTDRTTTYDIIAKLMNKGLVSYVIRNNVKYFQAAPPEQILADLKEKEEKVKAILPKLNALTKMDKEETSVEVFKGREGIRTLYKMMVKDGKDYYWIGGGSEACSRFPNETESFVRNAHAKRMEGRLLFRDGTDFFVGESERYRLIQEDFISSTTTTVWGDKTGIFVWSEPFYAIVIRNREVAGSNRSTFESLWRMAKTPSAAHQKRALVK